MSQRRRRRYAAETVLCTLAVTGCGSNLTQVHQPAGIPLTFNAFTTNAFTASAHNFAISPFGEGGAALTQAFQPFRLGHMTFNDALVRMVGGTINNPLIQVHSVETTPASANLAAGGRSFDLTFSVGNVPIEGTTLRGHLLSDGKQLLLGWVPNIGADAVAGASRVWPTAEDAQGLILAKLSGDGVDTAAVTFGPPTAVYGLNGGSLDPVLKQTVNVLGLPYTVMTNATGVVSMEKRFFDVDGSAQIYLNNVLEKSMVKYQLQDLVGDGTLTSKYLQTVLPDGDTRANEPSETFNYDPSDPRFAETMAYAHTDDHLRWLLSLGAQTYGALPIDIELHQLFSGSPNNALFVPGDPSTGTNFKIEIGDGDGLVLANLPTDRDVPSHESGHYVIFKYMTHTTGESLALHEGMADLLVFMQQGNPNLGKSICPQSSGACIIPGVALRTADNPWAYQDDSWNEWTAELGGTYGHKHGQVLSGLVWDLYKNKDLALADTANLTLKAITYFQPSSGFRDYLLSLLTADQELFSCKYDTQIRKYATARNLQSFIADVPAGCASLPAPSGTDGDSSATLGSTQDAGGTNGTAAGTPSTSSTKKNSSFACSVGALGGSDGQPVWLALVLALPLLAAGARPALALARRRRKP